VSIQSCPRNRVFGAWKSVILFPKSSMMNTPRILSAGIAALVVFPTIARAIDFNWLGNGDPTVWTDPLNWDGNGVPTSGGGSNIYVHTANGANIAGVALDAGFFYLAVGNVGTPTSGYTFGTGTYNVNMLFVGEGFNGTPIPNAYGNAFINAGTTINANRFHLGERGGASGHVVQSGGDVNISTQFRLGHWPQGGATNSYDLNGGTFTITGAAANPLDEGAAGNIILGVDSTGTFTVNGGTLTGHGITMQSRVNSPGETRFVVNGGMVNIGVNGFVTNQPNNLASYDIQLGGGTLRATAGWSSNLEIKFIGGGTGIRLDTNGNNVILSGALNGVGGFTKDGPGSLILSGGNNTYTGPTVIAGGTLQLTPTGSAPTSDFTMQSGSTLQVDAAGKTLQSLTLVGGTTLGLPAVTGSTTTITNTLNFTGAPSFTIKPGLFSAPAVNDTFDLLTAAGIIGAPGVITTDFGLSHASGHTSIVGNKLVLTIDTAGGVLTWSNGAGTGNWVTNADVNFTGADGKFLNNDQVTFGNTAAGTVNLVGTLLPSAVFVNSTANYTFTGSGSISGVGALNKAGSGTLTLGTLNSYTGGTNITGGVLELTAQFAGTGAIRGTVTVAAGTELRASGNSGAIFGYTTGEKIDILNINGGLVDSIGGDNHIWNATVNMTGGEMRVNGGVSSPFGFAYQWGNTVLNTLSSATTATVSGRVRIRGDAGPNLVLNVADGAAANDLLISAAIDEGNGAVGIMKNGAGIAEFSGGAVVSGAIRTTEGTLTLSGNAPFSAGQLILTGGSIVTLANTASLSVNTLVFGIGAQNETVGGALNVAPGTTVNVAGALRAGDSNGGGSLTEGTINQTGGTVNVNVPNTDGRNFVLGHWAATYGRYNLSAGTLNSPGISMAVSWDGTGSFTLSGGVANVKGLVFGNTYNAGSLGIFDLTGGELNLGDEGIRSGIGNKNTDINLGGGTVRAVANTLISLPIELTGTNGNTIFDTNSNTLTVTGAITGAGGFTKNGNGTMDVAFASFTGATTVTAGSLLVNGSLGGTTLLNLTGGVLQLGAPNLVNDVAGLTLAGGTFNTGGFSEGDALTVGLGLFTLTANSILDFGPGSGSELLFAGLGSHTAGTTLSIVNWTRVGSGDRLMFAGDDTARLAFLAAFQQSEISFNGISGYASVQYDPSHFEIVAVPEPASVAFLAGSLLLGLIRPRDRRADPGA
jgi:fibronectin-binding autotransporter adhesin